MLYLLSHMAHAGFEAATLPNPAKRCASTPWTEYLQFIPQDIPVPTLWSAAEQMLLHGTSLEVG